MVGTTEFYIPVEGRIDLKAERERITKEIDYYNGFLKAVNAKLSNSRFVDNAPVSVVDTEKKKRSDAEMKLSSLKEQLAGLKD